MKQAKNSTEYSCNLFDEEDKIQSKISSDCKSGIILGDVVEVLQSLDKKKKYEIVIIDPPYNISKDFGNNKDSMNINDYVIWSKKWLSLAFDLLSENGLIYVYGFAEILARIAVEYPIEKQRILIWHYTNKTTPSSKFWQRSYEAILCLWKNDRPTLEIDQIREPYTDTYLKCAGKERKNTKGRFGNKSTIYNVNELGALPRDVIKIPTLAGGAGNNQRYFMCKTCDNRLFDSKKLKEHNQHDILQHPTQKPMQLTEKLIKSRIKIADNINKDSTVDSCCNGRVLIPFAGSGSECVVAKKLGLEFLAIEINPEYVKYANKWLNEIS